MKQLARGWYFLSVVALAAVSQNALAACTSNASQDWKNAIWTATAPDTTATCNTGSGPSAGSSVVIANGTTVKTDANTLAVANVTINAGGTLLGVSGTTLTLTGNFTNNGTFTAPTGSTVAFTGTAQSITGNTTFANLTVSGTTLTLAGNITVTGTLTGTLNLASTCPTNYTATLANGTVQNSCATGGGGGVTNGSCIPTTINGVQTPIMAAQNGLQLNNNNNNNWWQNNWWQNNCGWNNCAVTVNGTTVSNNNNAVNSIAVTGSTTGVTPALPALNMLSPYPPATFPGGPANQTVPNGTIPAGSYGTISTGTNNTSSTFAGGITYIDTLNVYTTTTLGAGVYYINNLNLNANLVMNGAVQIYIGTQLVVNNNNNNNNTISMNSGGSVANLQVNFYPNATMSQNAVGFSFAGVIYAPYSNNTVNLQSNNNVNPILITGAVISAGSVILDPSTVITYGTTQQNQVAQMSTTCSGGGGTAGSFNAFETMTAANSTTGRLYTKLAGTAFTVDVAAIQTANTAALATNYNGNVKVELIDNSAAAACNAATAIQTVGTLAFTSADAGRKTSASVTVNSAWTNVKVRMTDTTSNVVSCSTDNFSIRPATLTLSTTSAITNPPTSVIKVGANFNLTATSNVASGYTGTPILMPANIVDENGAVITAANLTGAFVAATGASSAGTFQYAELGNLVLNAGAVQDSSFTAADQAVAANTGAGCVLNSTSNVLSAGQYGCNIGSAAMNALGRFTPDHFDTVVTQGCGTGNVFTYSGQPFALQVLARNAANITMSKYAGTYAKATTLSAWSGAAAASGAVVSATVPAASFALGIATVNPVFTFSPALAPAAAIAIRAIDSDAVSSLGQTEGVVNARVGRFNVANAVGADLYNLSMPLTVQYYSVSSTWVTNSSDTCTAAPTVSISAYTGGLTAAGGYTGTALTGNATLANGVGTVTVNKPSAKLARSGSATVTATAPAYFQAQGQGLATFSVFNGAKEFIYIREQY